MKDELGKGRKKVIASKAYWEKQILYDKLARDQKEEDQINFVVKLEKALKEVENEQR